MAYRIVPCACIHRVVALAGMDIIVALGAVDHVVVEGTLAHFPNLALYGVSVVPGPPVLGAAGAMPAPRTSTTAVRAATVSTEVALRNMLSSPS